MRQTHAAGEKLFVDFAGDTVLVFDGLTGEVRAAKIFVAVLGASNYTFAQARFSEALPDWIGAHVDALAFLGGVPKAFVCDNLKAGVTAASRYEPGVNRTYQDLATHYGSTIMPARPCKPRHKTSVSYCTSFGLSRGGAIQPCWTRAAPTTALDDLQARWDVPKPTSKAI